MEKTEFRNKEINAYMHNDCIGPKHYYYFMSAPMNQVHQDQESS